ncbi:MAG: polysulfide reductase NrfD [Deltaproteobacteria bacterium]|nr:polysulfide reductase NrfD [Deltaproteobacteria bacterium]
METGFVFPNEGHPHWTAMIVLYPTLSGIVAGAYIVACLYHVFGRKEFFPVYRFALAATFAFLIFAPLPLLMHLGRPERALNIMITPNFTSAMAGFGFVYSFYLMVVALEIWFSFRSDFYARAKRGGLLGMGMRLLLLGAKDDTPAMREADHRISRSLSYIGIPTDFILTGYVGFIFGTIKANPWWSTATMLLIFFTTALVAGAAMILFMYYFRTWRKGIAADRACVDGLSKYLTWFAVVAIAIQGIELLSVAYKRTADWGMIFQLITGKLFYSYVVMQFIVCGVGALALLFFSRRKLLRDGSGGIGLFIAALLLFTQSIVVRWNVVIGGQLISKSHRGFGSYHVPLLHREGAIPVLITLFMPFVFLFIFDRVINLFALDTKQAEEA